MSESTITPVGRVNIVVALMAEARPLIRHFGLTPQEPAGAFRVFANATAQHRSTQNASARSASIQLVLSGIGRVASAAAAGYLHGRSADAHDCGWLNVGIAGHRDLEVGALRLAHRVVDDASDQRWYPQRTFAFDGTSAEVRTVDAPERDFRTDALYDMEAAGFYAVCSRFSSAELVHVVKCVSDNRMNDLDAVTAEQAEKLIADGLPLLANVVESLATLAEAQERRQAPPAEFDAFLERWHFSVTQRAQLRDVLRRWHLLLPSSPLALAGDARTSRDVLRRLSEHLADVPPQLGLPTPPQTPSERR